MSERSLFAEVLQKYHDYTFVPKKQVQINDSLSITLFDIDYMGMRLNVLETFDEGEFVFA